MKRLFLIMGIIFYFVGTAFAGGELCTGFGTASNFDGVICTNAGDDNDGRTVPRCIDHSSTTGTFDFKFMLLTDTSAPKVNFTRLLVKNAGSSTTGNICAEVACVALPATGLRTDVGTGLTSSATKTGKIALDITDATNGCSATNKTCKMGADPNTGGFVPKNIQRGTGAGNACQGTECSRYEVICRFNKLNGTTNCNASATTSGTWDYTGYCVSID